MPRKIFLGHRSRQVLKLLHENGPMTNKSLVAALEPAIEAKRLRLITKRLFDDGIIIRRHQSMSGNVGHYYQLSRQEHIREFLAGVLGVSVNQLLDFNSRSQELEHWQECTLWKLFLQKEIGAIVHREFEILSHEETMRALLIKKDEIHAVPDLLLRIPTGYSKGLIYVAVEIERTSKTPVRVFKKLIKYAKHSLLDGVIYVCSKSSMIEALRSIYFSQVLQKASRIKHYAPSFLVFSECEQLARKHKPKMFDAELKNISVKDWIHFLKTTEISDRRVQYTTALGT